MSTETIKTIRDGEPSTATSTSVHTAPELWNRFSIDHIALRPQKRGCVLGTGTWGGRGGGRESEGSTADTARKRPERDRGPPPEQWKR